MILGHDAPCRPVEGYHRREAFEFFGRYADPFYDVALRVDVTAARAFAKDHGYSTYFNLCWLWTRALAGVEDFRVRLVDDALVVYDHLALSATVAVDRGPYGFARFGWVPDIHEANRAAIEVMARVRERSVLGDTPLPPHYVFFSSMPRVPFTGLSHVRPNGRFDGEPRITFGRFEQQGDRWLAPVGITVNHVFIDGGTLGLAVERAEAALADPR
jgi:chloramphenicol O-acetyltransferase type A